MLLEWFNAVPGIFSRTTSMDCANAEEPEQALHARSKNVLLSHFAERSLIGELFPTNVTLNELFSTAAQGTFCVNHRNCLKSPNCLGAAAKSRNGLFRKGYAEEDI